ncbi:iron complex outermembrane recepter protein [Duganella sacchari]|uniref:Iron complex outermembrane recepter protein n=1 Tax=Duganella sacchari TaxID=551987 RepID=A0A1M7PI69_9BURK|nr:TonB-dependent receptor [Duganella sacchari]SHN16787.1 iron complex outermembrane recepter protein [Duganella sacchari]
MMVETVLSRSVRLICASGLALGMQAAVAQNTDAPIQRVEITGSSIKRISAEGALPVQTLSKLQIEQSGASNVADLIATLPSMQGFTTSSMSVNGGGGGLQTASIHSIGEGYTLVLLNGRRLAPATSGSTVNLASIPLAAVERVEILTDGANTLYGSDAIAGVVNFILKKNQTDAIVEASYNQPRSSGGATSTASISKGWGDLDKDGFNLLLSASHDESKASYARERDFSQSGVIPFTANGKAYSLYQLSSNSIPGVATVKYTKADGTPSSAAFSPNLFATGTCNGANLFKVGNRCLYDYAATVENTPGLKRDSGFASLNFKLNENTNFFAEGLISSFSNTAQYAAPAQPLGVPLSSALYAKSIAPYLARLGITNPASVTSVAMNLRLVDAGGRADEYKTIAKHLALGVDGSFKGLDYRAAYTHSENKQTDTAAGGYMSLNAFDALVTSGKFDPFAPPGTSKDVLAPAVLHNQLSETKSKIDMVQASASTEVFQLPAGAAQLALGADFTRQAYSEAPDAFTQGQNKQQPNFTDAIVGGSAGALPIDASRKNWGTYGELLLPVLKNMDLTVSGRYDDFSAVTNDKNFDADGNLIAPGKQGESASKATYKLALRWNPVESVLIRGSYGTGFKAPTMSNIVKPLVNGGSSQFHACPITSASDPRFKLCNPGSSEYGLLTGGNASVGAGALKPEESKQATLGIRVEPISSLSLGFDLWDVKLRNQIQTLSEDLVFNNPAIYDSLLRTYFDPIQKQNVLVAALTPFNLASSHYQGIDWDHTYKTNTTLGKVAVQWTGTFMTKAEQETPGSGVEKNIGRFNSYANVTFRWISKLTASLNTGRFTHALTANYHSGYTDQVYNEDDSVVREVLADGSLGDYVPMKRQVASYTTFDWQTKAQLSKQFTLIAGVKNIADIAPPFTIRNAGGGNQSGYDGRYTDPLGRQFYLTGSYKF